MKPPSQFLRHCLSKALAVGVLALATAGCRKNAAVDRPGNHAARVVDPRLSENRTANLPATLFAGQRASRIHWQPWSRETFEMAGNAGRLVFAVIASPEWNESGRVLDALGRNSAILPMIRDEYVPVLVDAETARECALLASVLNGEMRLGPATVTFVWLTPAVHPVAWMPLRDDDATEVFKTSHEMISVLWREDDSYVSKNSRNDAEARRERIREFEKSLKFSKDEAGDVIRAVRQCVSLYDPISRRLDGADGRFPDDFIALFTAGALNADLPVDLRARCRAVLGNLLDDILPGAMFDPLDGGVFAARSGESWELPIFSRDCDTQARVAAALFGAWHATGNPLALRRAREVMGFAEASFATQDGVFAFGNIGGAEPAAWLWRADDVTKLLGDRDADWWIRQVGMHEMGNLPSEIDPQRRYFRLNSISLAKTPDEIAASEGLSPEDFGERFKQVVTKLRDARGRRTGTAKDPHPHLGATLRMASAYAAAYCATGETGYRDKAEKTLANCRRIFVNKHTGRLVTMPGDFPPAVSGARAFHHALAVNAAMDVACVTGDATWQAWADDLAATASELFVENGFFRESSVAQDLAGFRLGAIHVAREGSSRGLMALAAARSGNSGAPFPASLGAAVSRFQEVAVSRPLDFVEDLAAALTRSGLPELTPGPLDGPMKEAFLRLPPRLVHKRAAGDSTPAGSVRVGRSGKDTLIVNSPEGLLDAALPSR